MVQRKRVCEGIKIVTPKAFPPSNKLHQISIHGQTSWMSQWKARREKILILMVEANSQGKRHVQMHGNRSKYIHFIRFWDHIYFYCYRPIFNVGSTSSQAATPSMSGLTPSLDDAKSIPCDATNAQSMLAPLPQSPLPNFIPDPHLIVWESESGPSISYLRTAINLSNKMPLAVTQKLLQTLRVPKADKNFDPACIDIQNTVYLKAMKRKQLNELCFHYCLSAVGSNKAVITRLVQKAQTLDCIK